MNHADRTEPDPAVLDLPRVTKLTPPPIRADERRT